MSRPDRANLDRRSTAELLSMFEEYCHKRAETKTAKEKNKHADKIMAINAVLRERGETALAEQLQFVETAAPVVQIWAVKNLWELYPDRIRQVLHRLTEHTGEVSLSARFLLEEMA